MTRRRRRFPGIFIIILLIAAAVIYAWLSSRISRPSRRDSESAESTGVRVIDGDTFVDAQGRKVRLLGIDTPEKGEPFHDEAMDRLGDLIKKKGIHYEYGDVAEDRYGRTLAYVFAETTFVNACLLEEGLARAYFFEDDLGNGNYRDRLCESQRRALRQHRGLWSRNEEHLESRYFGNPKAMRFHRPGSRCLERADTVAMIRATTREELLDLCYSPCRNCKP